MESPGVAIFHSLIPSEMGYGTSNRCRNMRTAPSVTADGLTAASTTRYADAPEATPLALSSSFLMPLKGGMEVPPLKDRTTFSRPPDVSSS
jgi:hypothetical protein